MHYYNEEDLGRFGEIAKYKPELFEKFLAWYQACQEEGALSKREKALIGLAVASLSLRPFSLDGRILRLSSSSLLDSDPRPLVQIPGRCTNNAISQ